MLSEEGLEEIFAKERVEQSIAENRVRDTLLGIERLTLAPDNPDQAYKTEAQTCEYCKVEESSDTKISECGRCHMVSYCSVECQRNHWNEVHKAVCSNLSKEKDQEAKRIVADMHYKAGNHTGTVVDSLETLKLDDSVFEAAASKHGLFHAVETLFQMEAARFLEELSEHLNVAISWTQLLTTRLFKGDRANTERFLCVCPVHYFLTHSLDFLDGFCTLFGPFLEA